MIVVQQSGRSNELERAQASMADDVNEWYIAKSKADLRGDNADLRQRRERESCFHIRLHAADDNSVNGGRKAEDDNRPAEYIRRIEDRPDAKQQKRTQMDRKGAVENGARGRWPFHRAWQPAGKRNECGFAGSCNQQQESNEYSLLRSHGGHSVGPWLASHQL